MKHLCFWDIQILFVPHRKYITSPLQSSAGKCYVRFEVFMEVTMKNAVIWDAVPCGSCKSRRFGGTYLLHHQGENNQRARMNVTNTISCSLIADSFQPDYRCDTFLRNVASYTSHTAWGLARSWNPGWKVLATVRKIENSRLILLLEELRHANPSRWIRLFI
jgi:hypothetical protein